jgi:hypothetical protein
MITIEIKTDNCTAINQISYEQAKDFKALTDMGYKLKKMKDTARYLYGKKRGAWGRMTMADEKRSLQIGKMTNRLTYAVKCYNKKHNTEFQHPVFN